MLLLRAASFVWAFSHGGELGGGNAGGLACDFCAGRVAEAHHLADAARQADALGLMARAQTAVMLGGCDTDMARLQQRRCAQQPQNPWNPRARWP